MEVPSKKGRKMVSAKFSHPNKREKTATMTETACFSCGLAFLHRIHYEDHIRVFHDSKDANLWRLCEDCGKTFSSEMALNDHRTDHDVVKILWTLESHDWSSEPALEASELQSTSAVAPSQFKRPHSRYGRRSSDTQVPTGTGRGVGRPPKKPKDPDYIPLEDEKDERMKLWRKPRIIPSMASQFPDGVKVHKKRGRPRKHPIVLPTEVKSEVISPIDMSAQTKVS